MEMSGAEHEREHARDRLFHAKAQLNEQPESDERGKNVDQNIGGAADHDAADFRVIAVIGEEGPVLNPRPENIGGQHEQRLPDAIPAIKPPSAPHRTEVGIIVRQNLRLRGPEPVRGLPGGELCRRFPVLQFGMTKANEAGGEIQEKSGVAEPAVEREKALREW